jgi:release factor glutamine methyltransferase
VKAETELQTAGVSLVKTAARALKAAGIENPLLDAELLMAEALDATRTQVLSGSVQMSPSAVTRYGEFVARRAAREPLAYIAGRKEFFSLDFEVTPAVLIPRPETETLVSVALEVIASRTELVVVDLGTGSGAIAAAIAANAPGTRVIATDISKESLEVARRNAARFGYTDRIEFRRGDCWRALSAIGFEGAVDLVVSNPPYIKEAALDGLAPEISGFEPRIALVGGPDGLAFYRRILDGVRGFLKRGGQLVVEIGAGQRQPVIDLCRQAGCVEAVAISDLAGIARVIRARF